MRLLLIVLALMTGGTITATAKPVPRSVLIITQSSPSSGGAVALFAALGSDPGINSTSRIAVYTEHLDLNRFPSEQYQQLTRSYFRDKYRETPIGVVVVDGKVALDLVLSWRDELWSDVPVVFYGVDEITAAQLNLPPNVTGFVAHQTFRGMVDAARLLVRGLKRIALVGDPPERDAYRRNYRQEIALLTAEIELIDLTGLAITEVKKRVAVLPNDAVVFYTAIFVDGAGVVHTPQSALLAISGVTNRPIVTDVESQLGYGTIGGFVYSLTSAAREAVRLAVRILDGENASQIPVTKIDLNKPIFDWRELKRWKIGGDRLPAGSEIRFREPTAWDQYRVQILAILAVSFVQAALIAWLVFEHRRRHLAEMRSRNAMTELTYMNRRASAGQLSASIAHEVNQPLTGISTRASAALRWLRAETPNLEKAEASLEKIVAASHRASDIITSVRAMFRKDTGERLPVDINGVIRTVLAIVRIDLKKNGVELQTQLNERVSFVEGDKVQLQQVVLNLVMNAIEAMQSVHRVLKVKSEQSKPGLVNVSIEDTGTGIDPSNLNRVFSALFTTKERGIGMGLSICQSIIESHNGRIWVSPGVTRGSIVQFELPTSGQSYQC